MRYIKRFNEELDFGTYMSAADKLSKMGHNRRPTDLKNWADEIRKRKADKDVMDNISYWTKFDPFDISISKASGSKDFLISGKFHIAFMFSYDWFCDTYIDWKNDRSHTLYMPFDIGVIPADDDTISKFEKIEGRLSNESWMGITWVSRIFLKVYDKDYANINPDGDYSYEENDGDMMYFNNRSESLKFKKLIVSGVEGTSDYGTNKWAPNGISGELKKFFNHRNNDDEYERNRTRLDPNTEYNDNDDYQKIVNGFKKISLNQLYRES